MALHFLALDPGTLWTLRRDRYSSQAAQKQHARKRQDGSFHGIGSIHPFVTCRRVEALLYGRALWRDSHHAEMTLWTGTGLENLDVQQFIVGKKGAKGASISTQSLLPVISTFLNLVEELKAKFLSKTILQSLTLVQVLSGLYSVIAFANSVVFSPRFF